MERDDIIYALLLLISVPIGFLIRKLPTYSQKQWLSSSVGVSMVVVVCGHDGLHALLTAFVNALIVKFISPKKCHIISFIWCFGYIVFFRTTHYLGLPKVVPHANAVQLLLTLKLVGLAFEVHDTHSSKKKLESEGSDAAKNQLEYEFKGVNPSFTDMLFYSSCYAGLLTGPYFRYRTYHDMLSLQNADKLNLNPQMYKRMRWIPVFGIAYLILSHFIKIQYMKTDEFYENSFLFRLFYMVPMFTVFRFRMYFAWLMSEIVCMATGLGAYPKASKPKIGQGPTDLEELKKCQEMEPGVIEYDFETVHNIEMWGCEFAPNARSGMKCWNMSVQFWLATYVYRRVPVKSIRTTITMAVSAFWHGIHPGYYLSFLTIPPTMMAEDAMAAAFRNPDDSRQHRVYDVWSTFWKCRFLDYMAMGFMLLSWHDTTRYWASIYFLPHIVILIFIITGNAFKQSKPNKLSNVQTSMTTAHVQEKKSN